MEPSFEQFFGLLAGSLRLTSSVLYTRLSGFLGLVSWDGVFWDAWVATTRISYLMSAAAMCCGSWRLLCVGWGCLLFAGALNHFLLKDWILVLLKKLIAEMYVHLGTLKFGHEGVFKIVQFRLCGDLESRVKVTKTLSLRVNFSMTYPCSLVRMCYQFSRDSADKVNLHYLSYGRYLENRIKSSNFYLIKPFYHPNYTKHRMCFESISCFMNRVQMIYHRSKFDILSAQMKSRSPKPYHLFPLSQ